MVNKSRQLSGSLRKKMKNIFKEEYFQRGQRTARRIQKGIEKTG
jgi:hypothetical protein